MQAKSRRRRFLLFWGLVGLVLLLGVGQLLADPTQSNPGKASPILVTEFLAANGSGLTDEDGDYADWIELYNQSGRAIDLEGWSLTDDPAQADKWIFRNHMLESGDYLIVFASGKDRREIKPDEGRPYLHTSFRLQSEPGFLALYPPTLRRYLDGSVFEYDQQFSDVSYGVSVSNPGEQHYYAVPSPGAPNDERVTWQGVLPPPTVSLPHGYYDAPVTVELMSKLGALSDVEIRYTLDGSEPSPEHGTVYAEPIVISRTTPLRAATFQLGYRPSPIVTQSYIFVENVLAQPADPPDFPPTWGTHRIDFGGYQAGTPRLADYEMDPEIVNDAHYGPLVEEGLLSLPMLSLVTDMANLDIYANPQARGPETERPVSVEFFDPSGEEAGFQIDAGVRIQGGAGRWEFMPKHSFRLFFKQIYGASKLNYPFFADSPVEEFDTLVLRAGVDRSFAGHPPAPDTPVDHRQATYTRDEWVRASQIAASGVGSHGRFVHLYLNGLYWGLYNVVERPDAAFAAAYYGGDKDSWFMANHGGAGDGQIDRFAVMLQLAAAGELAEPEKYATLLEFVDPVQFSDYLIVNWYAGNRDWPENNWYVDVQNPAGRNRFFVWDAEGTWDEGARIVLGGDTPEDAPFPNVVKLLFDALVQNPEFRLIFADRLYHHLYHEGALTDENAQKRWLALSEEIEAAIVAESARWGDTRYAEPVTPEDWRRARDNVLTQMVGNGKKLIGLARAAGYYPAIDPPEFSQYGGVFTEELVLTMVAPTNASTNADTGEIYYTVDGSDPRTSVSGEPSPTARRYDGPLQVNAVTTVKTRLLAGETWSALALATFYPTGAQGRVQITEIMYNPSEDGEYEYIEIQNTGTLPVDLSRAYFAGVTFRFGDDVQIGPDEFMVLIQNFKKFRRRYPDVEVAGVYAGWLADGGETITLRVADGEVLDQVAYADAGGWPLSADGAGDSLVRATLAGDANEPGSWRASVRVYGSPGTKDSR